jgi:oxygen-independent coproporphyrinogen-3 oxidase
MESFLSGIRKITDRGIGHLSVYLLTLEAESPLGRRTRYSDSDENLQRELFYSTISLLAEKGYEHYEISNFARKGEESRHNNKYWMWEPYLGFGPSAHSFFDHVRYSNPMYHEYLCGGKRIIDERSDRMMMAEFIMTGLRLIRGISGRRFHEVFGVSVPEEVLRSIGKEAARGNLDIQGSFPYDFNIRIRKDRLFIADEITFEIVRSLL